MLYDYIYAYINAKQNNNIKEMEQIEKALYKLGMDKHTLDILVTELIKGEQDANT